MKIENISNRFGKGSLLFFVLINYKLKYYLYNCFLLLIPVIIWNLIFDAYLPEPYFLLNSNFDVPAVINWIEFISTIAVVIIPVFLQLKVKTRIQKVGLVIYFLGLILYLFAWRPIILYPNGQWATSLAGFISLPLTPIIFLTGIGLIGEKSSLKIYYNRAIYIIMSIVFVLIKTSHAILIYNEIY